MDKKNTRRLERVTGREKEKFAKEKGKKKEGREHVKRRRKKKLTKTILHSSSEQVHKTEH